MAFKPPIGQGTTEFYERIENNPDFYGPFWLIVTWWLILFIALAIESLVQSGWKDINVDFSAFD